MASLWILYWRKQEAKTLKKNESLSPLTPSQLGKWCKKYKRTSWAHLCPAPTAPAVAAKAPLLPSVCWAFICILIPVSCSWFLQVEGQDKSVKTATFHHQCWNFPTDYGPLCMDRLWFLCIDLHYNPSPWCLRFTCPSNVLNEVISFQTLLNPLHSFSKWELAHTLFRAFHHAGWYWLLWLSDSTCLIT